MQENNDTMWLEPTADVSDIQAIWDYALTVNGYSYASLELRRECGDLANERVSGFENNGVWEGSFEELRCCLFFEQRRWRHFGIDPDGNELLQVQKLFLAVRREWGIKAG